MPHNRQADDAIGCSMISVSTVGVNVVPYETLHGVVKITTQQAGIFPARRGTGMAWALMPAAVPGAIRN
jgi:hypothetical protein